MSTTPFAPTTEARANRLLSESVSAWKVNYAAADAACGGFVGTDSVGRPDDDLEAWRLRLVTAAMVAALNLDADKADTARDSIVRWLMPLVTALAAGSDITVEAVIQVSRAALPSIDADSADVVTRLGIAGMCVMWVHERDWFDTNHAAFGAAVSRLAWWIND